MSEDHDKNFSEFESHFRSLATSSRILIIFITLMAGFVFPLLEAGIMEGKSFELWIQSSVIRIILPFHLLALLVLAWRPEIASDFYFKYRKLIRDWKQLRETVSLQTEAIGAKDLAIQFLGLLHQTVAFQEELHKDFSALSFKELVTVAEEYIKLIELGREGLFGIKDHEFFNIAIYFHDPPPHGDGQLHLLARKTNIPKEDLQNRSWEIGRGQVGHTFARNECVITPDVRSHRELSRDQEGSDNKYYLSLAAIPLRRDLGFDEGSERIGVLIVSSSVPDSFSEWDEPVLENLAFVFSRYLDKVHTKLLAERRAGHGYAQEDILG